MALKIHCFLETKVLSDIKLNCASSPGSMNVLSISNSYLLNPNFKSIFPFTSEVLFILPEVSIQKTIVDSFSLPLFYN